MKKLAIYLVIILAIFVLIFVVNQQSKQASFGELMEPAERLYQTEPGNLEEATREQLLDENYQDIILPDELEQRLENEESLIVYFFSPACPYCVQTTPILQDMVEEKEIEIHQLNVLEYDQAFSEYAFTHTPTTIYFENGQEKDRIVGGSGTEEARQALELFLDTYGQG